jgi:hypothetical protein
LDQSALYQVDKGYQGGVKSLDDFLDPASGETVNCTAHHSPPQGQPMTKLTDFTHLDDPAFLDGRSRLNRRLEKMPKNARGRAELERLYEAMTQEFLRRARIAWTGPGSARLRPARRTGPSAACMSRPAIRITVSRSTRRELEAWRRPCAWPVR